MKAWAERPGAHARLRAAASDNGAGVLSMESIPSFFAPVAIVTFALSGTQEERQRRKKQDRMGPTRSMYANPPP
jgi:hypothetical protein